MRFYFEEEALWEERKREVLRQINAVGLPLVLFGKAPAASNSFLKHLQVPCEFLCDNDPAKWGTSLWGLRVICPADIQNFYSAYSVLILVPFERQIIPQLQNLPVPPAGIFRLDLYFEEKDTAAYLRKMQPNMEMIYDHLADQESRDTYEAVIRYRVNRDPANISRIALPRAMQYFPDRLGNRTFLHGNEIFVDAGAFTGDTVEKFIAAVQGRYHSIYAFEPELANFKQLVKNTRELPSLSCYQKAVSDEAREIRFISEASGSKADMNGGESIQADTLDHLLGNTPVSYLKMDVEGMERAALRGAGNIIQKHCPKLAVCTYHSNADMVEVPKLIWELNPDYHLYFRHYTHALVETVCYALPSE